jgi:hypothetical protein
LSLGSPGLGGSWRRTQEATTLDLTSGMCCGDGAGWEEERTDGFVEVWSKRGSGWVNGGGAEVAVLSHSHLEPGGCGALWHQWRPKFREGETPRGPGSDERVPGPQ